MLWPVSRYPAWSAIFRASRSIIASSSSESETSSTMPQSTHDVVVVAHQPFGQLVASETVGVVVLLHHSRLVEDHQRAVQGRERNVGHATMQFGGRLGAFDPHERRHQRASARRVADVVLLEPPLDGFMEFCGSPLRHCFALRSQSACRVL